MKLYIVHKHKEYDSTPEHYVWADVFKTRDEALQAIRNEIEADIDADMDGSEDNTPEERDEIMKICVPDAFAKAKEDGYYHTAILYYGDMTVYYDVTETDI